ncbi:MAG: hypothetical protein IPP29_23015 [Bacteroidetes bacterium]|nr:hypothetical protein [Bacteroidota bacterium]
MPLSFFARWKIGYHRSIMRFAEITDNNGLTWTPLCGKYTTTGGNQYFNQPILMDSKRMGERRK